MKQGTPDQSARTGKCRPRRFLRLAAGRSDSASLLYGCLVVDADGCRLGRVDYLLVDALTYGLHYLVLARKRRGATVVLPWHALYFDWEQARLVFFCRDPRSGQAMHGAGDSL